MTETNIWLTVDILQIQVESRPDEFFYRMPVIHFLPTAETRRALFFLFCQKDMQCSSGFLAGFLVASEDFVHRLRMVLYFVLLRLVLHFVQVHEDRCETKIVENHASNASSKFPRRVTWRVNSEDLSGLLTWLGVSGKSEDLSGLQAQAPKVLLPALLSCGAPSDWWR